jgi:hypothetical protein
MLHDNLLHNCQAQSCAICLRGVKGHKDPGEIVCGYAWPIVGDGDALQFPARHMLDGSADFHTPAKWLLNRSFGSIASQIQQGLAQ